MFINICLNWGWPKSSFRFLHLSIQKPEQTFWPTQHLRHSYEINITPCLTHEENETHRVSKSAMELMPEPGLLTPRSPLYPLPASLDVTPRSPPYPRPASLDATLRSPPYPLPASLDVTLRSPLYPLPASLDVTRGRLLTHCPASLDVTPRSPPYPLPASLDVTPRSPPLPTACVSGCDAEVAPLPTACVSGCDSEVAPLPTACVSGSDGSVISLSAVLRVVAQLCPILCNPVDCSPPGSSVLGDSPGKNTGVGSLPLLQGGCFQPRNGTRVSCTAGRFFTSWAVSCA